MGNQLKLKKAVQSGNWSDPNTWYGGFKPIAGDVVCSNGFDITIDEDVNVYHITNYTVPITATIATSAMIDNNNPNDIGVVVGSGQYTEYWYPFNRSSNAVRFRVGSWTAYKFNEPKVIDKYKFRQNYSAGHSRNVDGFTIDASNDGVNWVNLDTVNNVLNTTEYENLSVSNTTAYTYYRIYITAVGSYGSGYVRDLYLWEQDIQVLSADTEGGKFFINDNVTITCTDPVVGVSGVSDAYSIFEYNGSASATVNANFIENQCRNYHSMFLHTGTGTLNIVGDNPDRYPLSNRGDTTVYMRYNERYGVRVTANNSGTTNLVGNISYNHTFGSDRQRGFYIRGDHTFNITGDIVYGGYYGTAELRNLINQSGGEFNMTGDIELVGGQNNYNSVINLSTCNAQITGQITSNYNNSNFNEYIYVNYSTSDVNRSFSVVGKIETNNNFRALNISTNSFPTQLSGPFVCGPYGTMPFYSANVRIMNQGLVDNYFQFRDTTNLNNTYPLDGGNAFSLVSPDTLVDSPAQEDVREGTSYASGNYTGTLAVPLPSQVALGIATDDTVGTAVLTADDVWNAQTSAMNTDGSIGKRLKNSSTVDSTGDQLSSLL